MRSPIWPTLLVAVCLLLSGCAEDERSWVPTDSGPARSALVGTWSSEDSYGSGTFVLHEDGRFEWTDTTRQLGREGRWELEGSVLTWRADDDADSVETIALDGDTLYRDAHVRAPGSGAGLSGTWHQVSGSNSGVRIDNHRIWTIVGDEFSYRGKQSAYGEPATYSGRGKLGASTNEFRDVIWDKELGAADYGTSDHGGTLAVRLLSPQALWVAFRYPPPDSASGYGAPTPLNIWKRQ